MSISNAAPGTTSWQRRTVVVATALLVAVSATGCGGSEKEHASSPTASATKGAADPQAKAKAEVLAVYRHYWEEQVKAYAKASPVGTDLNKYAFDKAYSQNLSDLATMKANGTVMRGTPKTAPDEPDVNLQEEPKRATFKDCIDVSKWHLVNAKTGAKLKMPKERLVRYVTSVSARTVGNEWKVVQVQPQDRKC
ncbi:hypothetical protein [Streptomyces alfalfae]